MFEEHVYGFPKRVVEDLDHFLVDERILRGGVRTRRSPSVPATRTSWRRARVRHIQRGPHFRIALGRAEAHHDVFGARMASSHGRKASGQVQSRQRALADDHRMHKFDRDVLCVGGVRAAPKRQQTAPMQEAFGHFMAGQRQARRLAGEEVLEDPVALRATVLTLVEPDRNWGFVIDSSIPL